jgi:HlyD family secretion protein
MKSRKKINGTVIITIISLVLFMASSCHKGGKLYTYETAVVKKGSIKNTITATGTVQADTTVAIGTQVSGVIQKIYVDFNSHVKKGQLLLELDKTPLQTQVQQAQASLDDSKSEVSFQSATYERYKALLDKKLVAQADYDQVKYNYDKALANLKTAQAGFDKAMVNLNYATIYSPIKGVILNRAVDQGQTVAASFNTPNLFTIGNDLTQMQVQANVDEADIGQVRNGQPVDFSVDAYPNETFKGSVRQIRLQPVVTSNVVTYTVIVNAPNPDEKLMPGMTANITVLTQEVDSVLIVPGKAMRFTPDAAFLAQYMKNNPFGQRRQGGTGGQSGMGGQNRAQGAQGDPTGQGGNAQGRMTGGTGAAGQGGFQGGGSQAGGQQGKKPVFLWITRQDTIHRVRVVAGIADATNTEIKSGLKEGDLVILSMTPVTKATPASAPTTSPFMPTRRPQTTTPVRR